MPTPSYLTRIFGSSPVRPMQHHMEKVIKCVSELKAFITAANGADWEQAREIQGRIRQYENEADDIKKEIRLNLPKGIFMPFSRVDLLEMLRIQDLVANRAKDIAGLMLGRQMEIPAALAPDIIRFVERSIDAACQAQNAINELDELIETGFRGAEVDLVQSMIKKLDKIETETDAQQVKLRAALFELEDSLEPVKVMFLYQVIDWIGEVADLSQRVGSRLEYLLAR